MKLSRWTECAGGLLLSLAVAGCMSSETQPQAPVTGGGGGIPAPKPVEPLIFGPAPTPGAPATPATSAPRGDLTVLNVSVAGDPTRIVYPTKTLEAGQRYPVLIFFHGYGMDQTQLTERTGLADAAAREGWLSASGALGGRSHWANEKALRATGALIADLIANHQADPARLYLVGFSMGGGTALLAAANPLGLPYRVAAVASTQGFTDLAAMTEAEAGGGAYAAPIRQAYGGSLEPEEAEAHSPQAQAHRLMGTPIYLEHGDADTAVRVSHSKALAERLATLGIAHEFHLYEARGHGEDTIDEARIIAFLRGKSAR